MDTTTNTSFRKILEELEERITVLPAPYPRYVVFLSSSNGQERARVTTITANDFQDLKHQLTRAHLKPQRSAKFLRLDWVASVRAMPYGDYVKALQVVKRNYSRKGLSFDAAFNRALTEAEINANALLYRGAKVPHCEVNLNNLKVYWKRRFAEAVQMPAPSDMIYLFTSEGLFREKNDDVVTRLLPTGPNAGRRTFNMNEPPQLESVIRDGARYLANEVNTDGTFNYGWFPCFDRPIDHYNTLRHASSTYALSEAYGLLRTETLRASIERSLHHLATKRIIQPLGPTGPAYLVDLANEIKLGGNAVAILAICKHAQTTGDRQYIPLAERLGEGILSMKRADGSFNHVLHADSLELKQQRRTVYYDGEAAFALVRLHEITGDARWLEAVRQAVAQFIEKDYWQYNDHWLAYCMAELLRHDPDPEYVRFAVRNVKDYLGFIAGRITTFPTLLELCCATRLLIRQALEDPALRPCLEGLNLPSFVNAMEARAQYLANGVFFPEVAMHFRNPERIMGSFFIRHHGFRVRIDDVEHYLSGLIAYRDYLDDREAFASMVGK
ncbi:hypothetical protein [Roseinatronobacter alkalisoli]|uniref:Uncharacterized protein n=1 Tax=Roseinatronobacter alkalisoli TaxID=3028235 RepID=A0ABT5TD15_9RHOB|nr:hypothetical protein [Roseinatronobacter sp. HJB301]MDD7973017.1 hypothetical protein [Roseinatronobacter sp. HJB301]